MPAFCRKNGKEGKAVERQICLEAKSSSKLYSRICSLERGTQPTNCMLCGAFFLGICGGERCLFVFSPLSLTMKKNVQDFKVRQTLTLKGNIERCSVTITPVLHK